MPDWRFFDLVLFIGTKIDIIKYLNLIVAVKSTKIKYEYSDILEYLKILPIKSDEIKTRIIIEHGEIKTNKSDEIEYRYLKI